MLRKLMTLTALLGATVGCQAAFATEPALPTSRMLVRFGLERAWFSQAIMDPGRESVRYIQLDEDNLYVQSNGGMVTAFDAETGRKRWAVQLGPKNAPSQRITSNDSQALIIAGGDMYCLDKFDGDMQWQLKIQNHPASSPAMDNDNIYYGTLDGSVFAYDIRKVRELHEKGMLPQFSDSALRWRYKAGDEISVPPLVAPNHVLNFVSRDNSLYSLTTISRKLQWQFETDRPLSAPLGRSDGMIFLATEDFSVFCIREERGSLRWQFVAGLPIRKQPRIVGDDVYVFPERGGMYCVGKRNGFKKWWRPNLVDFVGATKNTVFVTSSANDLVALSRRDGSIGGSIPLHDFPIRFGNEQNDRLYLASTTGLVVCLRGAGAEFPTFHLYPERQPLIPEFAPENEPEEAVPTENTTTEAATTSTDNN